MSLIMQLIDSALLKLEGAYAPNTIRSYHSDACQFVDWCLTKSVPPFPLTEATLLYYVEDISGRYAYATLRRRIISIRRINCIMGHGDIVETEAYRLGMRRMRRSKPMQTRQAKGINKELLLRAIDAQSDTIVGVRNRALLSVGYDFLTRRSELTALRVRDIEFLPKSGVRGVIRRSKTDPYGRGRHAYGSERSAKLLRRWLLLKPEDIPWLFCPVNHGHCISKPLCDRSANEIIKLSIARVKGMKPRDAEVSGHSLRVGAAQDLLAQGESLAAIMRAGGWSSPEIVARYVQFAEYNIWDTKRGGDCTPRYGKWHLN